MTRAAKRKKENYAIPPPLDQDNAALVRCATAMEHPRFRGRDQPLLEELGVMVPLVRLQQLAVLEDVEILVRLEEK